MDAAAQMLRVQDDMGKDETVETGEGRGGGGHDIQQSTSYLEARGIQSNSLMLPLSLFAIQSATK
jgi:hypothetical protein